MPLPLIDLADWGEGDLDRARIAAEIGGACREHGFFYIRGHSVPIELQSRLEQLARAFFALPVEEKMAIAMARGGRAWRGYFPLGAELTSGQADYKEGLYFGSELAADHPMVLASTPLHGANLFPVAPGWKETVLEYLEALTRLGHRLMEAIALSLGLDREFFRIRYTGEPLTLFRIFNYPATAEESWGVGEHTDYGVLTILRQDACDGLEVHSRRGWIAAPPIPNTFVCNIGDMLDRMTAGLYRSTPHRVRNRAAIDRLSFPFFFDPDFSARVEPIPGLPPAEDDHARRWDRTNIHAFEGTYGDYLLAKVSRVFPCLTQTVLPQHSLSPPDHRAFER